MAERPLTPAQEKAVREYLSNGGDQSKAYRAAYPASRKWKPESVHAKASRLFARAMVKARIAALTERVTEKLVVEKADVLRSALRALNFDVRRILDEHGNVLPPKDWPDDVALAIDSVEFKDGKVFKVKPTSRAVARDQLARNTGFYEEDNAQRRSPFADVPREVLKQIEDLLVELIDTAPAVGATDTAPASRTAH